MKFWYLQSGAVLPPHSVHETAQIQQPKGSPPSKTSFFKLSEMLTKDIQKF